MKKHYVIIGNGAAGTSAAITLRKTDSGSDITMITQEKYDSYSRPLISYFLKDLITMDKAYLHGSSFYKEQRIKVMKNTLVSKIDTAKKEIILDDGREIAYDKLLLATGSIPFVPAIEGVSSQENVFTFLNFADAEKIRKYVKPAHKAVVVGGGLIGLKAAEGLSKICRKVTVIELADRILPTILDSQAAGIVGSHIKESGISYITGTSIDKAFNVENEHARIGSVITKNGKKIECDLLVMAVGVRPNIVLASDAGIKTERGILTDSHLRTSDPDIYAAGDCALSNDILDHQSKILALWPNAVEQGEIAAKAMSGADVSFEGSFAMNAIDFFGLHIVTAGLINPSGDEYSIMISSNETKKSYRKLVIRDGILVGYILIGDIDRAGIYTSLISEKTPLSEIGGDILQEVSMLSFGGDDRKTRMNGGELQI
ncbi:MAG: NAD(P)/FAD-dependent oxidoreductase [Saccharofermentanales bacterium]